MPAVIEIPDSKPIGRRPRAGAWLLLAPLILWLLVFVIAPVAIMVVYSFCQPKQPAGVEYSPSVDAYRSILNWPLFKALLIAGAGGAIGAASIVGVLVAIGRAWPWLGDWIVRHWRRVATVLFVCISWGVFRHHVISRVEVNDPASLTQAQQDEREKLTMFKIFVVSIDYAVWSTLICVVIGYPVAYFMGRAPESWRNILMLLIMVPFWTSFLIRTYAWVGILNNQGTLNDLLLWLNVISKPLDLWPSSMAIMIGLVYTYLPFMILPIYTSCERLDQSMIEASFDLGANPFRSFWTVILPLTWPGVVAGVVITFVPAIGMFAVNDILGGKKEQLIGNVIVNQFVGQGRNWPLGAALGMVLMGMFVVTYYLSTRKQGSIVG